MQFTRPKAIISLTVLLTCSAPRLARAEESPAPPMAAAATKLLESLPADLRPQAQFAFDDPERSNWHFIPRDRKGLPLKAMAPEQQELVHTLIRTGTSERGAQTARKIMAHELILRAIENTPKAKQIRDPGRYYVSIFGTPGPTGRWGWRVEGHHLSLNYTIDNNQVVSWTPAFMGANPARVPSGPQEGLRLLANEEDQARALYKSLAGPQREAATLGANPPPDVLTGAQNARPKSVEPAGVTASDLNPEQQEMLRRLILLYTDRQLPALADRLGKEIRTAGWDQVRFGWYGPTETGKGHAYRIQGPTFIIEYNNTQNNANHVHSLLRTWTKDFGGIAADGK